MHVLFVFCSALASGAVSTSSIYIISRGLFFNVKKKFSDASVACEGLAIALHF